MGSFSQERCARFVMFLGLVMLAVMFLFGEEIDRSLRGSNAWIVEDGWMHALGDALTLLGAWKWLNVREDARNKE